MRTETPHGLSGSLGSSCGYRRPFISVLCRPHKSQIRAVFCGCPGCCSEGVRFCAPQYGHEPLVALISSIERLANSSDSHSLERSGTGLPDTGARRSLHPAPLGNLQAHAELRVRKRPLLTADTSDRGVTHIDHVINACVETSNARLQLNDPLITVHRVTIRRELVRDREPAICELTFDNNVKVESLRVVAELGNNVAVLDHELQRLEPADAVVDRRGTGEQERAVASHDRVVELLILE